MQMEEQRREMRTEQAQCVFLIIPHSRMFNHRLNLEKKQYFTASKKLWSCRIKMVGPFFFYHTICNQTPLQCVFEKTQPLTRCQTGSKSHALAVGTKMLFI